MVCVNWFNSIVNGMSSQNAKSIFDKYALEYHRRYMDVSRYSVSLNLFSALLKQANAGVLDVGCGPGNISRYLMWREPELRLIGIDISPKMIDLAQQNNPEGRFYCMDARDMTDLNEIFQGVIASFYLPYLAKNEIPEFMNYVSENLGGGGILYISYMEGNYQDSGYVGSSENKNEKLFTYFHERKYLVKYLQDAGFQILRLFEIENPNNRPGVMDISIIAQKT